MEKKRQLLPALLCALVIVVAVGFPSVLAANTSENSDRDYFLAADDNVEVRVDLDKSGYTSSQMIDAKVTITNKSDQDLVYVHGSSSSTAPDALKIKLGRLTDTYSPLIATMDYRVHSLAPGEILELECSFAPYIAKELNLAVDTARMEIRDFEKSRDFVVASPGIVQGSFQFTYGLTPHVEVEPADVVIIDVPVDQVISGEFQTLLRVSRNS